LPSSSPAPLFNYDEVCDELIVFLTSVLTLWKPPSPASSGHPRDAEVPPLHASHGISQLSDLPPIISPLESSSPGKPLGTSKPPEGTQRRTLRGWLRTRMKKDGKKQASHKPDLPVEKSSSSPDLQPNPPSSVGVYSPDERPSTIAAGRRQRVSVLP